MLQWQRDQGKVSSIAPVQTQRQIAAELFPKFRTTVLMLSRAVGIIKIRIIHPKRKASIRKSSQKNQWIGSHVTRLCRPSLFINDDGRLRDDRYHRSGKSQGHQPDELKILNLLQWLLICLFDHYGDSSWKVPWWRRACAWKILKQVGWSGKLRMYNLRTVLYRN